jgi:hypothetical protein
MEAEPVSAAVMRSCRWEGGVTGELLAWRRLRRGAETVLPVRKRLCRRAETELPATRGCCWDGAASYKGMLLRRSYRFWHASVRWEGDVARELRRSFWREGNFPESWNRAATVKATSQENWDGASGEKATLSESWVRAASYKAMLLRPSCRFWHTSVLAMDRSRAHLLR